MGFVFMKGWVVGSKKVFCKLTDSFITKIEPEVFDLLERYLIENGLDADKDSFAKIKEKLQNSSKLNSTDFAFEVIYVILASGFNQQTAKRKYFEITEILKKSKDVVLSDLLKIFNNQNKMKSILKVWNNKDIYCKNFYNLTTDDERLRFLETLPFIGKITKNHLARNLGMNMVKYDVWIKRLGIALYGTMDICDEKVLDAATKIACDKMFNEISQTMGLKKGYIDVVLWKSCQIGLLQFESI